MGLRRIAREIALRILFQYEVSDKLSPREAFDLFCDNFGPRDDEEQVLGCTEKTFQQALPFINELYFGVTDHMDELDRELKKASENWRVDRMSRVDRNVMRLALYEMLYLDDIPHKVSINEAIDLGKEFGSEDSGGFINGVLDRIHQQLMAARAGNEDK